MIYTNTSSKYIIAKIFRDLNPQHDNFVEDAFEWIGEALELIGAVPQYKLKSETLQVIDHKVHLPCDLYLIEQVSHNGVPMRYGSQSFPFGLHCNDCVSNSSIGSTAEFIWVSNPNALKIDNSDTFLPLKVGSNGGFSNAVYYIDNDWLKTSFKDGEICLFYRGFLVDEDNYPLVPNHTSYREALYWYVRMKMIGSGIIDPVFKYTDAEDRWLKYCTQARNKFNMPDVAQMEAIKDRWVRLIPQMNVDKDFFQSLGSEEYLTRNY